MKRASRKYSSYNKKLFNTIDVVFTNIQQPKTFKSEKIRVEFYIKVYNKFDSYFNETIFERNVNIFINVLNEYGLRNFMFDEGITTEDMKI